jgi:hypothetical protein
VSLGRDFPFGLEIRLDEFVGLPEGFHVDDEVLLDLEVRQRFDDDGLRSEVLDDHLAGQADLAVDRHPARPADRLPAAVAEGQGRVLLVPDVLEGLEDRVLGLGRVEEFLEVGIFVGERIEAEDLEGEGLHGHRLSRFFPWAGIFRW